MEFPKLSSPTLKDMFVHELEKMILSGQLAVGYRLPSERELAETMQVSRSVVNSGLAEMAKKGFIEVKPRVGAVVSDYRRRGSIDTLLSIMRYNGGKLRRAEVKAFLEVRLSMETLALEQAARNMTPEGISGLKERLAEYESAANPSAGAAALFEYHHELCVISGNIILPLIFYSFREPAVRLWERYLILHGVHALLDKTRRIQELITLGNFQEALAVLRKSIESTIEGEASIYFD